MSRIRAHRLQAADPWSGTGRSRAHPAPWTLSARAATADLLGLGDRIALAADLQRTAGNRALGQLVGLARTDRRKEPPDGAREIMEAGSGGARGLTRSSYVANPPIFRIGRVDGTGGTWTAKPAPVRLPSLDHEVFYPAPGRHRLRAYGAGSHILDVTEAWSNRILEGENEHVADIDRGWEMTWGRVAAAITAMVTGEPVTGATADEARAAVWREFKRRLPAPLRPEGDTPTTEAQEAKWGAEDRSTIFRQLMNESKRARDTSGWHTPDQNLKAMEGDDRVDELADGRSRIPGTPSDRLMREAWDRVTGG